MLFISCYLGNSYEDGEHLLSAAELMEDDRLSFEQSLASGTVEPAQSLASTKILSSESAQSPASTKDLCIEPANSLASTENLPFEPAQSKAYTKNMSIEPAQSMASTKILSIEPVSQESRMQGLASTEAWSGGEKVKVQPIPIPHSLQEQEHGEVRNLQKPLKKVLLIDGQFVFYSKFLMIQCVLSLFNLHQVVTTKYKDIDFVFSFFAFSLICFAKSPK